MRQALHAKEQRKVWQAATRGERVRSRRHMAVARVCVVRRCTRCGLTARGAPKASQAPRPSSRTWARSSRTSGALPRPALLPPHTPVLNSCTAKPKRRARSVLRRIVVARLGVGGVVPAGQSSWPSLCRCHRRTWRRAWARWSSAWRRACSSSSCATPPWCAPPPTPLPTHASYTFSLTRAPLACGPARCLPALLRAHPGVPWRRRGMLSPPSGRRLPAAHLVAPNGPRACACARVRVCAGAPPEPGGPPAAGQGPGRVAAGRGRRALPT